MGFNIKKYCHINDVLYKNGMDTIEYDSSGISLIFVNKGKCIANSHGVELQVNFGEIVCFTGAITVTPNENSEIFGVNISGIIADKFSKEIETAFVTSDIFSPFLPQQIVQVVKNIDTLSETYLSNISFEILNNLSHTDKTEVVASQLVTDAINMIKKHYSEDFTIENMAVLLHVSKSHLVREFFKHTGTTPGKYLIEVRIDAVKQLLTQTSLQLDSIALQTGFSGDNYLCKAFKKVTGETPMSYKERIISSQYLPNQLTLKIDPDVYTE